jgi:hypothetical protein
MNSQSQDVKDFNKQTLQDNLRIAMDHARTILDYFIDEKEDFLKLSKMILGHQLQLGADVDMLIKMGSDFSACIISGVMFEQALFYQWINIDEKNKNIKAKEWFDYGHIAIIEQYNLGKEERVKSLEIVKKYLTPFLRKKEYLNMEDELLKEENYYDKWYEKYKYSKGKSYYITDIVNEVDEYERKKHQNQNPSIKSPNKYVYSLSCKYRHNDSYRFITNLMPGNENPDDFVALYIAGFSLLKIIDVVSIHLNLV